MGEIEGKSSRSAPEPVTPLLAPIQALQSLLSQFDDRGVLIGGVAASLLGTPRYTVDLDAVVLLNLEDIPELLAQAAKRGIEPRNPDPCGFARQSRVLLLRHVASGTNIDISLGILPFELEMVERSRVVEIGSIKLRLPTPEDLIIMKVVANRPKDLLDIQSVAAHHPDLDRERIRGWIKQFGEALDRPDLWQTISQLL
jgi:predicted nucleotidyltransferase